jgi:hypothetical protein
MMRHGTGIAVVNIFVIPRFVKVFESFHAELPLMTRMLIGARVLRSITGRSCCLSPSARCWYCVAG